MAPFVFNPPGGAAEKHRLFALARDVPQLFFVSCSLKKGAFFMGSFDKAQNFVVRWEFGPANHAADSGSAAKFGVSLRLLKSRGMEVGGMNIDGDIDMNGIRSLPKEEAAKIMKRAFWDALGLDDVKPLCAMVLYDTAVSMGKDCAKRMAQKALGVPADGVWGPVTRSVLRVCDDRKNAAAMCHIRRARYCELVRHDPALKAFLKGWLRRVDALERAVER